MNDDEHSQAHSLKPNQVFALTVANGMRDVTVSMGDGTVINLTLGPGNSIDIRAGHDIKSMVLILDMPKLASLSEALILPPPHGPSQDPRARLKERRHAD
jgi:hypothetical protein